MPAWQVSSEVDVILATATKSQHWNEARGEDQQVSWAPEIIVVFNEARDERIDRFHRTVLVERHHDDVAAEMLISDDYNGAVYRDRQAVFQLCAILSLS